MGFSMGGGEVARCVSAYGSQRLRSVVFASAVPPYLMTTPDNPDGPLTAADATKMAAQLSADPDALYDGFVTAFFTANGELAVTEQQRQDA